MPAEGPVTTDRYSKHTAAKQHKGFPSFPLISMTSVSYENIIWNGNREVKIYYTGLISLNMCTYFYKDICHHLVNTQTKNVLCGFKWCIMFYLKVSDQNLGTGEESVLKPQSRKWNETVKCCSERFSFVFADKFLQSLRGFWSPHSTSIYRRNTPVCCVLVNMIKTGSYISVYLLIVMTWTDHFMSLWFG